MSRDTRRDTQPPLDIPDLRLFYVAASDIDTEFYVCCASKYSLAEVIIDRARLQGKPVTIRKWRAL